MIDKEAIKERLHDVLRYYGAKPPASGKGNWDCCNSSGHNKSVKKDLSIKRENGTLVCCCHCGLEGDALNVIEIMDGITDFNEQLERGCQILGIQPDDGYIPPVKEKINAAAPKEAEKRVDNSSLIGEWHKRVGQTDYFKGRGLTEKTINKYRLGYNPAGSPEYGQAFKYSLPVTNEYVIFREEGNTNGRYRNTKGEAQILNTRYIQEQEHKYIFITEGYFDALSLEELDYKAIGLNSTAMKNSLIDELKKHIEEAKKKVFILITDNDQAGDRLKNGYIKKDGEKEPGLIEIFNNLGLTLECFDLPMKYNDVNEYLIDDRQGLKTKVDRLIKGDYVSLYLEDFFKEIKANKDRPIISTGFLKLNGKMGGGIFPGLYVVGGISSLGKTAFTLQVADYIAAQGHDVIFFSLEMSKTELISRSISRHLFKIDRNKCRDYGTLKISRGQFEDITEELNDALRDYAEGTAENLIIKEGNFSTSVDTVRETVQAHKNKTDKPPVVFIDYLQILKGKGTGTDKQETDYIATELKRISRDFDIPIIVVSSFSRQNYYTPVGMEAFKESGAIEYTADVLIGLQLTILNEMDLSNEKKRAEARSIVNTAKSENPRKVSAIILKQRNATPYCKQDFIFYPVNNLMQEV